MPKPFKFKFFSVSLLLGLLCASPTQSAWLTHSENLGPEIALEPVMVEESELLIPTDQLTLLLDQELFLALTVTSHWNNPEAMAVAMIPTTDETDVLNNLAQELATAEAPIDLWGGVVSSLSRLRFDSVDLNSPVGNVEVLGRTNLDDTYVNLYGFSGQSVRRGLDYTYGLSFSLINPSFNGTDQRVYDAGMANAQNQSSVDNFGDLDFTVNLPIEPETELPTALYTAYRDEIEQMYRLEPFGGLEITVDLRMMPQEELPMMTKIK